MLQKEDADSKFIVTCDQGWKSDFEEPLLTVLNFSGGKQSSALLWMILLGDLPTPKNFIVLTADPGMENTKTYIYVAMMQDLCRMCGIYCETAKGPNLYKDLLNAKKDGKTRLDNPPYWVDNAGKRGRLLQKCTQKYKIQPMDRAVRRQLYKLTGISENNKRIPYASVHKWIGFSKNETSRIKPPQTKYIAFRYPLIELGFSNVDVEQYYRKYKLPIPPRSVCNACFANGLDWLKECRANRPADWEQVIRVDRSIRDLSFIGIKSPCFVSSTLKPVEELAKNDFTLGNKENDDEFACTSGYCFT